MVQIHKNFSTLASLVGHSTSSRSSDTPQIEDIGAFDVPSWYVLPSEPALRGYPIGFVQSQTDIYVVSREDMQARSLPMSPPHSKENFHNHIMHLKNDPFGLDMQDTLLTMTKTQFDEIQEESAKVILPVLHSLSSDQGPSERPYLRARNCSRI
jgi:hypothetical protein